MKVLLIDPPGWQKHSLNLGLAYLSGAALQAGFDVHVLDMNNHAYTDERIKKIIIEHNPGVIGISVKTATANASADIIRRLKDMFPGIIYVAGGPHITLCGKEFMQENKEIDFGITGEGEISFVNLIKGIKSGKRRSSEAGGVFCRPKGGLIFNNNYKNPDISGLVFPNFEYIRDVDFTNFRYPLLTSRGCPYGCVFCCVGLISGRGWRPRTPENVVEELIRAKEDYQAQSFEIMDDNFTFDIERAKKICRLIIKGRINMDWWCHNGLRADRLDQGLLNLMKKAGCKSIALGIESGAEEVFKNINKGEKLSDIIRAVRMVKKAGIKCVGYFIIGLPGDSIKNTKKTVRLQRRLGLADYKYNMLIPYPGTKIWEMVKEKGRLLTDIRGIYHFGDNIKAPFETDAISKETLEECMYLAENQGWVHGEVDLKDIKRRFNVRFGRDVKRIALIENNSSPVPKNMEIEFKGADVLRIKQQAAPDNIQAKCLINADCEGSYFKSFFELTQKGQDHIILDMTKKKLAIKKPGLVKKEYTRGERLPHPLKWDDSARKYYAARLNKMTSDECSAKNGVIYKDNIALPFSHTPQWEKTPCGKIESGLAFISIAAFNPGSVYTADYLAISMESELRELTIANNKDSALDRIIRESDILFCPEASEYFSIFFSASKMNVVYYPDGHGAGALRYRMSDIFSTSRGYYLVKAIIRVFGIRHKIKNMIRNFYVTANKCGKVCVLWAQILACAAIGKIKNTIAAIVRF